MVCKAASAGCHLFDARIAHLLMLMRVHAPSAQAPRAHSLLRVRAIPQRVRVAGLASLMHTWRAARRLSPRRVTQSASVSGGRSVGARRSIRGMFQRNHCLVCRSGISLCVIQICALFFCAAFVFCTHAARHSRLELAVHWCKIRFDTPPGSGCASQTRYAVRRRTQAACSCSVMIGFMMPCTTVLISERRGSRPFKYFRRFLC